MSTSPADGMTIRARIFSSVDLPAPFLPMIPITSPGLTSKLTFLRAQSGARFRSRIWASNNLGAPINASRKVGCEFLVCPTRYRLLRFLTLMIGFIFTLDNVGKLVFHVFENESGIDQQSHSDCG